MKSKYVYVASSWRNAVQPDVVSIIRSNGIDVYDFKNPAEGEDGFHWTEVMPSYQKVSPGVPEQLADPDEYIKALFTEEALHGFSRDFEAMERADTFVLVLPCGRSAHLELGWAVGRGLNTAIVLDGPQVVPELMYKMVDIIFKQGELNDMVDWLRG